MLADTELLKLYPFMPYSTKKYYINECEIRTNLKSFCGVWEEHCIFPLTFAQESGKYWFKKNVISDLGWKSSIHTYHKLREKWTTLVVIKSMQKKEL